MTGVIIRPYFPPAIIREPKQSGIYCYNVSKGRASQQHQQPNSLTLSVPR